MRDVLVPMIFNDIKFPCASDVTLTLAWSWRLFLLNTGAHSDASWCLPSDHHFESSSCGAEPRPWLLPDLRLLLPKWKWGESVFELDPKISTLTLSSCDRLKFWSVVLWNPSVRLSRVSLTFWPLGVAASSSPWVIKASYLAHRKLRLRFTFLHKMWRKWTPRWVERDLLSICRCAWHEISFQGAGDAFVGALAFYLACMPQLELQDMIQRSGEIASRSVLLPGTQTSYLKREQLPSHLFKSWVRLMSSLLFVVLYILFFCSSESSHSAQLNH